MLNFIVPILLLSYAPHSFAAESACSQSTQVANATLRVTPSGVSKIVANATNMILPTIEDSFHGKEYPSVHFGPNPKKCTEEKLKEKTFKDAWSTCYGLPNVFLAGNGSLADFANPVPADFTIGHPKIEELRLGNASQISCDDKPLAASDKMPKELCYELPVEKFSVSGSLAVRSQKSKELLFSLEHWKVELGGDSAHQSSVPSLHYKVLLDPQGKIQNIVELSRRDTKLEVNPSSVHAAIELSPEQIAKIQEETSADFYKGLQEKFHLPAASTEKDRRSALLKIDRTTWAANIDFVKELAMKQMEEKYESSSNDSGDIKSRLANSLSFYLLRTQLLGNLDHALGGDKGTAAQPSLGLALRELTQTVNKSILTKVSDQVNVQLSQLPVLQSDQQLSIAGLNLQDAINGSQDTKVLARQTAALQSYAKNLGTLTAFPKDDEDKFKADLQILQQAKAQDVLQGSQALQSLLEKSIESLQEKENSAAVSDRGFYAHELLRLRQLEDKLKETNGKISKNVEKNVDPIFLRAVGAQMADLQNALDLALTACTSCDKENVLPADAPFDFNSKANYDFAAGVSYDSINNFLKVLQARKAFDVCLGKYPEKNCTDSGWLSMHFHEELLAAPKIGSDQGKLYIDTPKVNYGVSFLNLQMEGRAYIDLKPCNDGGLCVQVQDVKTKPEALATLIPKDDLNKFLASSALSLPPQIKTTEVVVGAKGISVYADFRDGSLPATIEAK